jgi:hypothetical protein
MPHLCSRHTSGDPDPVDLVRLFMEFVVGQFIDHIQENKNTTGQPDGKTKDVDKGISPVSPEVSEGNYYITFKHGLFS